MFILSAKSKLFPSFAYHPPSGIESVKENLCLSCRDWPSNTHKIVKEKRRQFSAKVFFPFNRLCLITFVFIKCFWKLTSHVHNSCIDHGDANLHAMACLHLIYLYYSRYYYTLSNIHVLGIYNLTDSVSMGYKDASTKVE